METLRTQKIKSLLNLERYSMYDFWAACPHDMDKMKSNSRLAPLRSWRQVGMVWARLTGISSIDAGLIFYRDHATVLHAEKNIINVLDGYGDPLISAILKDISDHINFYIPINDDVNINEASCLVMLDALIGKKIVYL